MEDTSKPEKTTEEEDEGEDDEFEPTVDFHPVIPLPPLVETEKGDENEDTIYEIRAKLFRFNNDEKSWVERGLGKIKILQHKIDKAKVRIVMWREQMNYVACNHLVTADTLIEYHSNSDKELFWSALDFAYETPFAQVFACKFSKAEHCKEFKDHLDQLLPVIIAARNDSEIGHSNEKRKKDIWLTDDDLLDKLSNLMKERIEKAEGSWKCDHCMVRNNKESLRCHCCDQNKPPIVEVVNEVGEDTAEGVCEPSGEDQESGIQNGLLSTEASSSCSKISTK